MYFCCGDHCCITNATLMTAIIAISSAVAVCIITALIVNGRVRLVNKKYDSAVHFVKLEDAKTFSKSKGERFSVKITSKGETKQYDVEVE